MASCALASRRDALVVALVSDERGLVASSDEAAHVVVLPREGYKRADVLERVFALLPRERLGATAVVFIVDGAASEIVDGLPMDLNNAFLFRFGALPLMVRVARDATQHGLVEQHYKLPTYPAPDAYQRGALYSSASDVCWVQGDAMALVLLAREMRDRRVHWAALLSPRMPRTHALASHALCSVLRTGTLPASVPAPPACARPPTLLASRLTEPGTDYRVSADDSRTVLDLAAFLMRCGRIHEAASLCDAPSLDTRRFPTLLKMRAIAAAAARDHNASRVLYGQYRDALLEVPDKSAIELHDIASVYLLDNDLERALQFACAAVALDPWSPAPYKTIYELSKRRVTNEHAQEALFVWFTSLSACSDAGDRISDRDVVAHYTAWLKGGKCVYTPLLLFYFALFLQHQLPDDESKPRQLLEQAVRVLQGAHDVPAWSAPIWCQFGMMEEEAGRSGRDHFERSLRLRGDDSLLLLHYGATLALGNDCVRGMEMLQRAARDDREPWTRLVALVAIAVVGGRVDVDAELRAAMRGVADVAQPRLPLLRRLRTRATGELAALIAELVE